MSTPKKDEKPAEAATVAYVVARGEIPQGRDPKTRIRRKPLTVGDVFVPAADDDVEGLIASGVIMTKEAFATAVASPLAQEALDAANTRLAAAEAELAKLKSAAAPTT